MIEKYRKKPVTIDAVLWTGFEDSTQEVRDFVGESFGGENTVDHVLFIRTLEGDMRVSAGDYVIKGVKGEFYPCKPDIFHTTYDKV